MLKIFKQGIILQLVLILGAMAVLWSGAFVHPVSMPAPDGFGPIYELLYGWLGSVPRLATGIALLLVLGEALLFNELLYSKTMVPQNTLLPMMLYVLIMSQDLHTITPALIVNLLILVAMTQTLQVGQPSITVGNLASAAVCVSLSSLVYLPAAVLLLSLLVMMPLFKMYRWNDWNALLLGLLAPYIGLAMILHANGTLLDQPQLMLDTLATPALRVNGNPMRYICGIGMMIFIAISLINGLSTSTNKTTAYKNNVALLTLPMIIGIAAMVYDPILPLQAGWFAIGTTFTAQTVLNERRKKEWINEVFMLMLVAITILSLIER